MGQWTGRGPKSKAAQQQETAENKLRRLCDIINRAADEAGVGHTSAQKFMHGTRQLKSGQESDLVAALGGGKAYEELRDQFRSLRL